MTLCKFIVCRPGLTFFESETSHSLTGFASVLLRGISMGSRLSLPHKQGPVDRETGTNDAHRYFHL